MVQVCIHILRIPFEGLEFAFKRFKCFEFAFECFESCLNGSNLHSNASNPFQTLRIPFEWFEYESLSSGLNFDLNALNPFRMVQISIRMLRIPLKWLEFAFECFESLSKG